MTMVSRSGTERFFSFISRGGIVGELAILDGLPRSASVVAARDTVLSRLSRAEFDAFAEKHPELYKSLITLLTQRLRETNVAVAAGSFLSLRGRVARTLLELADHFGREVGSDRVIVRHKIGQSDLAAMTGIARENLSRILKDWERRKIVIACRVTIALRRNPNSSAKCSSCNKIVALRKPSCAVGEDADAERTMRRARARDVANGERLSMTLRLRK